MEFLFSPTFTVQVGTGDKQRSFVCHDSLFLSRSQNIAMALQPDRWQEDDDRIIPFLEDDPAIFAAYLHFVYRPDLLEKHAEHVNLATFGEEYTKLSGVYVLADMLMDEL
ncbi:hypothetical protein EK21DRAFT_115552 [Setomelanomma holmii]|uniref:BTB domain-containing protein n=1 Tax=Setomelanomma holmii TaxID=210430 RepID=A0A9P4LHE7_9PLEO|nr:hypothetical protein EK21DRAFT_115552 [Setomelanomma holmii]